MTPRRLSELEKSERRRAWIRTMAVLAVGWIVLISVYYLVPPGVVPARRHPDAGLFLHLGAAAALFAVILAGQARRILAAELPELRAIEALGFVVPLFLVLFAAIYLSLSNSTAGMFSEPLNHTRALYFAVTIFSTVGFGDITPKTDPAMIVVSFQIMLDLVLLVGIVRAVFFAAQVGVRRRQTERDAARAGTIASESGSESQS